MSFEKKQDTIRQKVLDLVKKHPTAITDYRKLIQYYWYYMDGLNVYVPMEKLEKLTQPESISRALRKLVEEGDVVVDPATKTMRANEQANFRKYYGRRKPKVEWGF